MILVWVFDGLRPDLVTPELMPALSALRERGAWFSQSYCAFPPVTRVNAATLGSGSSPARHGIPGNTLCLRDPTGEHAERFGTTGDDAVLRGLRHSPETPLLNVPTLAETLATHGLDTLVVGTGSPGCAYLLHPEVARVGGAIWHPAFAEPAAIGQLVAGKLGQPPEAGYSTEALVARVEHAARALTDVLVPELRPALVCFWCTVPDGLHHRFGLGSPEALAGLRQADAIFGQTLAVLAGRSDTALDVIVTADHGYATVDRHVDVAGALDGALANRDFAGRWAVTVDGGAAHLFARGASPDTALREATLDALLAHAWTGAVFVREATAGALPLAALGIECERAPDLLLTFDWSDAANRFGYRGLSPGGGGIAVGAGDHGGGSPHELCNTLFAAGPSFQRGVYAAAAGIADIAPTVCDLLGIPAPDAWNGRVLAEALAVSATRTTSSVAAAEQQRLLTAGEGDRQIWLSLVERGGREYVRAAGRGEPSAVTL